SKPNALAAPFHATTEARTDARSDGGIPGRTRSPPNRALRAHTRRRQGSIESFFGFRRLLHRLHLFAVIRPRRFRPSPRRLNRQILLDCKFVDIRILSWQEMRDEAERVTRACFLFRDDAWRGIHAAVGIQLE